MSRRLAALVSMVAMTGALAVVSAPGAGAQQGVIEFDTSQCLDQSLAVFSIITNFDVESVDAEATNDSGTFPLEFEPPSLPAEGGVMSATIPSDGSMIDVDGTLQSDQEGELLVGVSFVDPCGVVVDASGTCSADAATQDVSFLLTNRHGFGILVDEAIALLPDGTEHDLAFSPSALGTGQTATAGPVAAAGDVTGTVVVTGIFMFEDFPEEGEVFTAVTSLAACVAPGTEPAQPVGAAPRFTG